MKHLALIAGGAVVLLAPAAARAQLALPARISSATITTTASTLSDAKARIVTTTTVAPNGSGSIDLDLYTTSSLVSLGTAATGDVAFTAAVTGQDPDDYGYAEIQGTVSATGPAGGSFSLVEAYRSVTSPEATGPLYYYADGSVYRDYGFLPAFSRTDLPSVEFFLPVGGAGLVDQGGRFVFELSITGDFSGTAGLDSGPGQHYLAHLNPAWTVKNDFVYDPLTNLTTFRAEQNPYDYATEGPFGLELDAFFLGAAGSPVPEPSTWASMTLGMLLVGGVLRRRRAAPGAWGYCDRRRRSA